MEENPSEANVQVINRENNSHTNLKRRAPSEAHATLGIFIAPLGNWESEYKKRKEQTDNWADNIGKSKSRNSQHGPHTKVC